MSCFNLNLSYQGKNSSFDNSMTSSLLRPWLKRRLVYIHVYSSHYYREASSHLLEERIRTYWESGSSTALVLSLSHVAQSAAQTIIFHVTRKWMLFLFLIVPSKSPFSSSSPLWQLLGFDSFQVNFIGHQDIHWGRMLMRDRALSGVVNYVTNCGRKITRSRAL